VLGLDAATIARAFLVPPATMAQRLVRAKAKIRLAGIGFALPGPDEIGARLAPVLDAIYAAFTRGWAEPGHAAGEPGGLAGEAIWLGRILAALVPGEPEAAGLLSLLLHLQARRGASRDGGGAYVPLDRQDPALWDGAMIDEAEDLLHGASLKGRIGRYQLEAALQSARAVRRWGGGPDSAALEALYEGLWRLTGSPVVALNRAMLRAEADPAAALAEVEALAGMQGFAAYQPWWAARAELLVRTDRRCEAREAYDRAIALASEVSAARWLEARRAALD
jgi:RNA polymerase sigma-70 factor (ECF subfamily)